jgi:hypothetical protein
VSTGYCIANHTINICTFPQPFSQSIAPNLDFLYAVGMGRPRCDPFDVGAVKAALGDGVPMLRLYRDYASVAGRPYSRVTFEAMVRVAHGRLTPARRQGQAGGEFTLAKAGEGKPSNDGMVGASGKRRSVTNKVTDKRNHNSDTLDLPAAAEQDELSDAYWERWVRVKPRVLTTIADNTSLHVRGGALQVQDGDHILTYEHGQRNPKPSL